jgi:hypothetical protein
MDEKLTKDEKKILEDLLMTPHWKVIQKLLYIYQRNAEATSMGVSSMEELAKLQGAYRMTTQLESDIRRIAKEAKAGKG